MYLFVVQYCSALLNLVKHRGDLKGKKNVEIRKLRVLQRRVKCKISWQIGCLPAGIRFYVRILKLKLSLEFEECF